VNERDIFHAAIQLTDPTERSAYVEKVCAGNASLQRHVENMLQVYPELGTFLESPAVDLESAAIPPLRAGRFQLGRELARGGMGVVYSARDESLGRDVAVKVLHERYLVDSLIGQRFLDEARITAQLQHPGVPPVFEVGRLDDERPYLAMKLIKGRTLEDLLKERADPASDRGYFLAVFQQVCQAVGYAHDKHILHRDLKPANVMVGAFAEVQVMDWGLAKLLPSGGGTAHEPDAGTETTGGTVIQTSRPSDSGTLAGSMLGTPAFMAPEQAGGELDRIDERTDVFGLGAILCVILTGEPPYSGKAGEDVRLMAIRGKLAEAQTRLDQCGADAKLVELCRACLSTEQEGRPRDAGAVADTIAGYLAGVEERARQAGRERAAAEARTAEHRKRRRVQLALAATVLVLLGLVGFGLWWQERAEATAAADRAARDAKALAVVEAQKAKAEAAEETGRKLLYTTDMQLAPFLWSDDRTTAAQLRDLLATHIPQELRGEGTGDRDLRGFEWYYDKHLLDHSAAVFSGHGVAIADAAFTSQGGLLTLDQNGQLRRWDLDSQEENQVRRLDLPGGRTATVDVLSPDGRLAALVEGNKVRVFDTSTGKEKFQLDSTFTGQHERPLVFSKSGDKLVIADDKIIRWCNTASGEVIGSVAQTFTLQTSIALSADGLTLAQVGNRPREVLGFLIHRLDPTTRRVATLAKDLRAEGEDLHASALSPDGRRLAIGCVFAGSLFVFDTATGDSIAKYGSAHPSPVTAIAFSGDGTKLATADAQGTIKIWADAQNLTSKRPALRTLKGHQGTIARVGFSSDGKRLVSGSADKTARVWDLENAGAAIRPLEHSGGDCWMARFSPDGQLIAAADGNRVRLWDAATGRLVRDLSAGDGSRVFSVAFSPTDSNLLATGHGGQANVSHVSLWDIHAGTEIARLPGATDLPGFEVTQHTGAVGALAFSPDGKYLVAGFGSKWLISWLCSRTPLKVWEVATRRLLHRLTGHAGACVSLDFTRDGTLLASASRDGTAIIWSTATWESTQRLQNAATDSRPGFMVEDVAFSPDGNTLAIASREGSVQLWDVAGGKLLQGLKGHSGAVQAVAFSPDGRTLASGGADQTVRLWNVQTRRELMQLDPGAIQLGSVYTLTFSPDGKQLLTGGEHGGLAFWSAAPIIWNDPGRAAEQLRFVLKSNADFQSRIRMLSENLRLHAALEKLDVKDGRLQAALAATRANWHAARREWPEAVAQFDRLLAADPATPEAWLRSPGLLRLATALVYGNRPDMAAKLLQGGAQRRVQDGLPPIAKVNENHDRDKAAGELFFPLLAEVEKRLGTDPRDVGLLELRAELAGQQGDLGGEAAHYTKAIKILAEQPAPLSARRHLLYRRRGDLYLGLQKWSDAVDDYAHVSTGDTTDADLLSKRAGAYEALKKWDAAAADWSRAAQENPRAPKLLAAFARRLAAAGQMPLANAQFEKSQALYEGCLQADPESDALAGELSQLLWDKCKNARPVRWTVLQPAQMESQGNATLTHLDDHSILAGGLNPQPDRYTVRFIVPEGMTVRSIRLEALAHDSLPGHGPGRGTSVAPGGRFTLSRWDVTAPGPGMGRAGGAASPRPFGFRTAWADPPGNGAVLAPAGEWNITGGEGKNHTSVWSLSEPVTLAAGSELVSHMRFHPLADGADENLGRFRVSLSEDPAPCDRAETYYLALGLTDPWAKLAGAYALAGRNVQASRYFSKAIKLAEGYEARKPIVELAARFDNPLVELFKQQPDEPLLQLAWARTCAERGKQRLAQNRSAEAQAELKKAREIYTRLLAMYPEPRWAVLKPAQMKSAGGATLTRLDDNSILAGGKNPVIDTYTVVAATDLPRVTAFRLEAMVHESLPRGGPGRRAEPPEWGRFALSEMALTAGPLSGPNKAAELKIANPVADFEQMGHPVVASVDGNPVSAWAIDPQAGKNHWAVFAIESSRQAGFAGGTQLTFTLDFRSYAKHTLGRFRLSVTDEPTALQSTRLRLDLRDGEVAP
jgi:WD40 repeat protein/tetratricopeptide (TPR) repeat protein